MRRSRFGRHSGGAGGRPACNAGLLQGALPRRSVRGIRERRLRDRRESPRRVGADGGVPPVRVRHRRRRGAVSPGIRQRQEPGRLLSRLRVRNQTGLPVLGPGAWRGHDPGVGDQPVPGGERGEAAQVQEGSDRADLRLPGVSFARPRHRREDPGRRSRRRSPRTRKENGSTTRGAVSSTSRARRATSSPPGCSFGPTGSDRSSAR